MSTTEREAAIADSEKKSKAARILAAAENYDEVIVIGYNERDGVGMGSTTDDLRLLIYMLEFAKTAAFTGEVLATTEAGGCPGCAADGGAEGN